MEVGTSKPIISLSPVFSHLSREQMSRLLCQGAEPRMKAMPLTEAQERCSVVSAVIPCLVTAEGRPLWNEGKNPWPHKDEHDCGGKASIKSKDVIRHTPFQHPCDSIVSLAGTEDYWASLLLAHLTEFGPCSAHQSPLLLMRR
uniref:Uncharacterized protein n=1 Tax=Pseudictyota dubia TaxID=2749911 RepID=A0A7R9VDI5_9STRA